MKDYISLKKWTLFSTCVYFGAAFAGLGLFNDLLDDVLRPNILFWTFFLFSCIGLLLILASLIYSLFHILERNWCSLLTLGVNATTLLIVYLMGTYDWPARLEIAVKWFGLTKVAHMVESGAISGSGKQPLPFGYKYLTRVDGTDEGIDIERQRKGVRIFFPLNSGFWGDLQGIVYLSNERIEHNQFFPEGFYLGKKICPHWYAGGYSTND